jgi:DNA-binding winged helix-turn-helix (wHTH) protein
MAEIVLTPIGNARFDLASKLLLNAKGHEIALRAQSALVLDVLIQQRGQLVTTEQLMQQVWGQREVTPDSVTQCIAEIRKALGDHDKVLVQTMHRRGYRLMLKQECKPGTEMHMLAGLSVEQQSPHTRPAVAVLPFAGLALGEDATWSALRFSAGLCAQLSQQDEFRVISRQSSFTLKTDALSTEQIGANLGARYLIFGTLGRMGDLLRCSLEVVNVQKQCTVASFQDEMIVETLNQATDKLLHVVSGRALSCLKVDWRTAFLDQPLDALGAEDLCSRVMAVVYRNSIEAASEAIRTAELAVARYPCLARAWQVWVYARWYDLSYHFTGAWTESRAAALLHDAQKTVSMDSKASFAYAMLSTALSQNGLFEESVASADQALQMAPADLELRFFRALILNRAARFDEVVAVTEAFLRLTRVRRPGALGALSRAFMGLGSRDKAMLLAQEALAISPGCNLARQDLIVAHHELGQHAQAHGHAVKLREHTTDFSAAFFGRSFCAQPQMTHRYFTALKAQGF